MATLSAAHGSADVRVHPRGANGGLVWWARGEPVVSQRVHRPSPPLTPGEEREREARLLAALSAEGRARLVAQLAELGLPDVGWYRVLTARRWVELLAWRARVDEGLVTHQLTRRAAEDWAARQLGLAADTLRTRLRGAVNSTAA